MARPTSNRDRADEMRSTESTLSPALANSSFAGADAASRSGLRLCVTGSFGCHDVGDEAMLTEDLHYLVHHLRLSRTSIDLIGRDAKYVAEFHHHPLEHCHSSRELEHFFCQPASGHRGLRGQLAARWRAWRGDRPRLDARLAEAVERCDALLITGGGTVNTRDRLGKSLKRMHGLVMLFHRRGIPIFMSGQTIGPLGVEPSHDALARELVAALDVLTVRDNSYSRHYLETIGAQPKRFVETFDDAYTLPHQDAELPEQVASFVADGDCVAINTTSYTSETAEHHQFVAGLCEHLVRHHGLKVVLVGTAAVDYDRLGRVEERLPNDIRARTLRPDLRAWRDAPLKKLISCCRLAVGGRYHFIVFAGTSDTPFVGMCGNHYSYIKQNGFARQIDLERFILTEAETWQAPVVQQRIAEALKLELDLQHRFARPSVSMQLFGDWLQSRCRRTSAAA